MTCAEFRVLVDAYALGALDPAEAEACAAHLNSPGIHDGCVEAYRRAVETVERLARAAPPMRPSKELWEGIERRLEPANPVRTRWSRRERFLSLVAAAAVVTCVSLGWLLIKDRRETRELVAAHMDESRRLRHSSDAALADAKSSDEARIACLKQVSLLGTEAALQKEALKLLEQPTTRVVSFTSPASPAYHTSAVVSGDGRRAIVLSSGMAIREGSDLELWVIRGKNAPRPAGFLRARSDGTAAGEIDPAVLAEGAPDALAVSIEPAGGRLTPTEVILVGPIKS